MLLFGFIERKKVLIIYFNSSSYNHRSTIIEISSVCENSDFHVSNSSSIIVCCSENGKRIFDLKSSSILRNEYFLFHQIDLGNHW